MVNRPDRGEGWMDGNFGRNSEGASIQGRHPIRKGALVGGLIGLCAGIFGLVVAVLMGAAGGAAVAKISQLRLEKGSAPKLYFLANHQRGSRERMPTEQD